GSIVRTGVPSTRTQRRCWRQSTSSQAERGAGPYTYGPSGRSGKGGPMNGRELTGGNLARGPQAGRGAGGGEVVAMSSGRDDSGRAGGGRARGGAAVRLQEAWRAAIGLLM